MQPALLYRVVKEYQTEGERRLTAVRSEAKIPAALGNFATTMHTLLLFFCMYYWFTQAFVNIYLTLLFIAILHGISWPQKSIGILLS